MLPVIISEYISLRLKNRTARTMSGLFTYIRIQLLGTGLEINCQTPVPRQVLFIRLITLSICIGAGDILENISFIAFPLVSDDIIFL